MSKIREGVSCHVYEALSGRPVPFSLNQAIRFKAKPTGRRYETDGDLDTWLNWSGEEVYCLASGVWILRSAPDTASDVELSPDDALRWFKRHPIHLRHDCDGKPKSEFVWDVEHGLPREVVEAARISTHLSNPSRPRMGHEDASTSVQIDPENSHSYVEQFAEVARLAQGYYDAVNEMMPMPGWEPIFQLEVRIADRARAFLSAADDLQRMTSNLPAGMPPRYIKRDLDRFASTIEEQLDRWGWGFILGPDGDVRIRERVEAHQEIKWFPVLRAALAWRSIPDVGDHRNADGLADEAERRGLEPLELPPDASPESAEKQTWARYSEWRETPVLGTASPAITEDERRVLAGASDHFRGYVQQLPLSSVVGDSYGIAPVSEDTPNTDGEGSHASRADKRSPTIICPRCGLRADLLSSKAGLYWCRPCSQVIETDPGLKGYKVCRVATNDPNVPPVVLWLSAPYRDPIKLERGIIPDPPADETERDLLNNSSKPESRSDVGEIPPNFASRSEEVVIPEASPVSDERGSLLESQRDILDAALTLGAINSDTRRPQDEIARSAGLRPHAGNTGFAFSELVRRDFLDAKTGRGGGTWLTTKGQAAARTPDKW